MSLLLSTSRKGLVGGDPPAVPAAAARRLSAIQRDAATLALAALHRAGTERPDAIIASTALGCLDDTERFLADMHDANGALLSPLPFMRSTHNTMAGQLALMLGCHGPNITHAQGLDGFHASLVEAELLLHEHPEWRILVLAID
ncbi:MAG: beta-ketoacyl synthase chain length factor, partial [Flavobacteriales bacterium]|nr:beta-ketoacyl synthase chain length factor [Flavobacteriales bacterium]